jgi:small subunit ribosomal protein S7
MRHKKAEKQNILPDVKYGNLRIAKFINYIMKRGKKSTAQKIVYGALDLAAKKTGQDPIEIFEEAIKNVSPALEVRSKRVGGANYQIPFPVRTERKFALAARWIIEAAKGRKGVPMHQKLAEELALAAKGEGAAVKKKADVQRMAEANRAFAHFAR